MNATLDCFVTSRSRVRTEHLLTNTSRGLVTSQVVRIDQPSILTSGLYHCKVATFTMEEITTHSLLIFGEFKLSAPLQMQIMLLTTLSILTRSYHLGDT